MSLATAAAIFGSGLLSSAGQLYANKKNVEYQQEANQLQVDLANSAHQREISDLKAAGLNPLLSAQGSGASVPQLTAASVSNPGEGVAGALSSAAKVQALEIPKVESQVAVNSATARNLEVQNELLRSQINNTDAQTLRTLEESDHPGAFGNFLQSFNSLFNGSEAKTQWDRMKMSDPPSSAKMVHDLGTLDVEAPAHRWYHHIPGFRD